VGNFQTDHYSAAAEAEVQWNIKRGEGGERGVSIGEIFNAKRIVQLGKFSP